METPPVFVTSGCHSFCVLFCPAGEGKQDLTHTSGQKPQSGPVHDQQALFCCTTQTTALRSRESLRLSYQSPPVWASVSLVAPTCAPVQSRAPPEHPPCLPLPFPTHQQASQTDRGRRNNRRPQDAPDGTDHREEGAGRKRDGVGARQTVRGQAYV